MLVSGVESGRLGVFETLPPVFRGEVGEGGGSAGNSALGGPRAVGGASGAGGGQTDCTDNESVEVAGGGEERDGDVHKLDLQWSDEHRRVATRDYIYKMRRCNGTSG